MKKMLLLCCILLSTRAICQNIRVSMDLDTAVYNVKEPLDLWLNFLKTRNDSAGAQYWNTAEVKKYGQSSYFLPENEYFVGTDNYLQFLSFAQLQVLNIRKVENYYRIRTAISWKNPDGSQDIESIFHVYAGLENGELKLYNALTVNTQLYCNTTTIGYIKYHYPKTHKFDAALAQKESDFLYPLQKNFGAVLDTVDYYFAPTQEEIKKIKGYDLVAGMSGEEIPEGKADLKNKMVFCAVANEYCPHELVHIFLNPLYPNSHLWFNEGLATYFGSSRGYDLEWHLKRLNIYLQKHPEIDLNNMLKYTTIDQYTDYRYVLGGLLVKMAYQKGSYPLVKKMLNSGKSDPDFYAAITKYLGIKQQDLNTKLREDLMKTYGKYQ